MRSKKKVEVICYILTSLIFFATRKCQKIRKTDKNSWYWRRKSSYLLNKLRNFNDIFRKDVTYDNVKSYKKQRLHAFSEKQTCQIDPSPDFLGLRLSRILTKSELQKHGEKSKVKKEIRSVDISLRTSLNVIFYNSIFH